MACIKKSDGILSEFVLAIDFGAKALIGKVAAILHSDVVDGNLE